MTKIRKQPRRSTKRVNQIMILNPFVDQNYYEHLIPNQVYNNLSIFQKISVSSLDEYVPECSQDGFQANINLMKKAFQEQQNRMKDLRDQYHILSQNNLSYSSFQISINSNVEQTKKTVNNTQVGLFPDEDGLFNFCDLQDSIMKKKKQNDQIMDYVDWGFLTSKKDQHEMIHQVEQNNQALKDDIQQEGQYQINMIL